MRILVGLFLFLGGISSIVYAQTSVPQVRQQALQIHVLDRQTNLPIEHAQLILQHEDGSKEIFTTDTTGYAAVYPRADERCLLQVQAFGYATFSDVVALPAEGVKAAYKYYLVQAKRGTSMVMQSVGFERGTTKLLPGSYEELDRLAQFLLDHPNVKIELSGHTDQGGVPKANQLLSEQRVETVKNYLVAKGIAVSRISGKGYGGRKPMAPNDTEDNKSRNRRVEVKIL